MTAYDLGRGFACTMNEAFSHIFDQLLNAKQEENLSERDFARGLEQDFASAQADWLSRDQELLQGLSLDAYLGTLNEDDFYLFFKGMAEQSDFPLPEVFEVKFSALPEAKQEVFLNDVLKLRPDLSDSDERRLEEVFFLQQALHLLAISNKADLMEELIDWYLQGPQPDERVSDAMASYVKALAPELLDNLILILEREIKENPNSDRGLDRLLEGMVVLAQKSPDGRQKAYPVFRLAFRKFTNKQLVTICLGDLGTLSAIPLLRSYIEDHHETIDRSLYLEIISAIKRLGGSTEDLPRPFGQDLDLDDRLKFLFGLGGGA